METTPIQVFFAIFFTVIGLKVSTIVGKFILGLFWSTPEPEPEPEEDHWAPKSVPQPTGYTRDWATVSRNQKEMNLWTCQECGVYLGKDRNLLHVHHRDRNPQNNSPYNLETLCVICHSERPGAGHRRLAGAISNDGRRWRVEQLRRRW